MAAIGNAWKDGAWIFEGWATGAWNSEASCALTGTIIGALETDIVSGGRTIVLTLSGDTWVADGATFEAQRQAIIDGLDSAESEATGWNAEVRDKEVVGAVVRTSDTVVTITLSAAPAYAITANEVITATVPAAALVTSGSAVVASPMFTVANVAAAAVGVGGGSGAPERKKRKKDEGRRLPPFTGEGFFPEPEEPEDPPEPALPEPAPAQAEARADVADVDESALGRAGAGRVVELAEERERRRAQDAQTRAERLEAERLEQARLDQIALLEFLEAEGARRAATLADDADVVAAYLLLDAQIRQVIAEHLIARQSRGTAQSIEATLRRVVGSVIDNAADGGA